MSEVAPLISDLAIILIIAGIVTVIFKWMKQPVILGYIVAGIITGPSFTLFPTVSDPANIKTWADIGVIFLLFAMGLDFSFRKLMNVGFTAVIATITIVCGMMFLGYTAGHAMGFSTMSSIFLGGMLCMSSTAIVFKAFNDMGIMQQKFTGIVLGILVVEDLVAVVMMVILSTLAVSQHFEGNEMIVSVLKLATFLIFWSVMGIFLLPTLLRKIRRFVTDETLLIMSLGLCLGMVMIAIHAGFSAALGAFVMGSLLAETIDAAKIERMVRPVKDLFASIFFVSVGMMVDPVVIGQYAIPILILTVLVLVGQAFFGSFGVLLSGQPLKVAIQSGFSLAQVGEFAFIIASLGVSLKVTDTHLYPVIVAVSVITTFLTPYMIRLSGPACQFLESHLPQSVKNYLDSYAAGNMTTRHQNAWHKLLKSMALSVTVYLVICGFFITLFFTYAHPWLSNALPGLKGNVLSFVLITVFIAPFIRAIIMSKNHSPEFHKLWADNMFNRGTLVSIILVKILLCLGLVTGIIVRLFNVASGVGLILALAVIGLFYFSKTVRRRSLGMERQFMANFQGTAPEKSPNDTARNATLHNSSPFKELHLASFSVSPDFKLVGQTIRELGVRNRFGINILAVKRGDHTIDIPSSSEHIYPYDQLTAVGTDRQLADFQNFLEQQQATEDQTSAPAPMSMKGIAIDEHSPLRDKTIREARLTNCVIVGVEREDGNLMNPSPDTRMQQNDTVWVVGKRTVIRKLCRQMAD